MSLGVVRSLARRSTVVTNNKYGYCRTLANRVHNVEATYVLNSEAVRDDVTDERDLDARVGHTQREEAEEREDRSRLNRGKCS